VAIRTDAFDFNPFQQMFSMGWVSTIRATRNDILFFNGKVAYDATIDFIPIPLADYFFRAYEKPGRNLTDHHFIIL
jgi:hypothetical protein